VETMDIYVIDLWFHGLLYFSWMESFFFYYPGVEEWVLHTLHVWPCQIWCGDYY